MSCPCGAPKEFDNCCQLIHNNIRNAKTSEQLMRARYSAFAIHNIDFLIASYHHTTRRFQNKKEIENWAIENKWMQLEIINATNNTVEFKAHYIDSNFNTQTHHEKSNFKKENGIWYYVDGEYAE